MGGTALIRLFTTHYRETHHERAAELIGALSLNGVLFDEVVVLAENCPRPAGFRGRWFECRHRQTYADLLALAADQSPEDITVLANTDIAFGLNESDQTTLDAFREHLQPGDAWCLTRWDVLSHNRRRLFDAVYSQDVWAFLGAPREGIGGEYFLGVPGCDNRFAHELDAAGYRVLNPSRSVKTYHHHQSGYRTSNTGENRLPLPYLYVSPHALGERPRTKRPTRIRMRPSQFRSA